MTTPIIYWFRQDLRTRDLPGLIAAAATGRPLLACYILDDISPGDARPGEASRWWLHHSLQSLSAELSALGGRLLLRSGAAADVLDRLLRETGATEIFCSRVYQPWATHLEQSLHDKLSPRGVTFRRFAGSLLFDPDRVKNRSGAPFKVFTPFWRHCRSGQLPQHPGRSPRTYSGTRPRPTRRILPTGACCPPNRTGPANGPNFGGRALRGHTTGCGHSWQAL